MSLFENFPYTNFHELNQDWILKILKELNEKFDEAISAKIKFADPIAWDITKQYEQLTIVINDNKAYLSMKAVPSGIAITNTEYWQNIFDMSELIQMQEDYEEEMTGKFDDLKEQVEDVIEDLDTDLSAEIARVESESVKNNSTKHILFVGDSYTTWYSNKLFDTFVQEVGVPAAQCHCVAESGAGFIIAQTKTYIQEIQDYTGNKTEITDIIVCGGINDALLSYDNQDADTSALQQAIRDFKTYANANYPNAILHIAYVGGCMSTSSYYETLHPHIAQQWALWNYTVFAGGIGYNVLKAWNAIHASIQNYASDGLHPSEAYGSIAIGQAVAAAFNENAIVYNRPQYIYNFTATGKNLRNMPHFAYIINDMLTLSMPDNYIQIKNGETIGSDQWYPILELTQYKIRQPHFYTAVATIAGFTGMSNPKQVPLCIQVLDGVMSVKIMSLSGSSFETLTAGSFSTITFHCLNDITVPLWDAN